jgi:hypothetical protein
MSVCEETTEDQATFGRAVVAFIDLLGFGDAVVEAVRTWEEDPVKGFNSTIAKVIKAQEHFDHSDWIPREDEVVVGEREVVAFSDCIVWVCPIQNPTAMEIGTYNDLLLRYEALAIAQFRCIQDGIFVRGAVDVGFSYRLKSVFVSDALVTSARAESRDVCYSVIAINPILWKLMQDAGAADSGASKDRLRVRTYEITKSPKEIIQLRYLDYLRLVADSDDDYPGVLSIHKLQVEIALNNCPPAVRYKYTWLAAYHNAFIDEQAPQLAQLKIHPSLLG